MTIDPNRYAVLEQLRALDFEPTPVVCSAAGCERLAEWALTLLCPRQHGSLFCGPHGVVWIKLARRLVAQKDAKHTVRCSECPEKPTLLAPFWSWRHL